MAITKSANSDKRSFVGVITAAASQEDAVAKYNSLLAGEASMYTSKSGNVQIISDPHTHIFNPITTSGDMDECEVSEEMSSLSSADTEIAHLGVCSDGCNSYVLASSSSLLKFCPVCAGAVDPLDDEDEDLDGEFEDLETFDDSYESESGKDESEEESDEDEDFDLNLEEDEEEDESPKAKKDKPKSEQKEEPKDEKPKAVEKPEEKVEDKPKEEPKVEDKEKATARVISVASSRKDAIKTFVKALVEQESVRYVSENCGTEFFASEGSTINFDPSSADVVAAQEHTLESISSVIDSIEGDKIEANFMVCSNAKCAAHIVSNFEHEFCPVCASSVEEPEVDQDVEDFEDDEDTDLDLNVSFDDEPEEEEDLEESESSNTPEKVIGNVLSFVAGGNELVIDKLDVSYSGAVAGESSWTAFYNGQPIARATSSSASRHKGIFENPAFANAVYVGAKDLGIPKILVEMGFQPTMTSISVSDNLKQNILNRAFKEKVQAIEKQYRAEMSERNEEFQQRFVAALSTAAMGINRGFFKGYTNPMKASLWNALSASGMRNPEVVIDNIFKSHSDDYHKALLEKTQEILQKPVEVQNELATAVAESNFMEVSASSVADDVESRLSGLGKVVPKEEQQSSTSSNVVAINPDRIKSVIAGLGRR